MPECQSVNVAFLFDGWGEKVHETFVNMDPPPSALKTFVSKKLNKGLMFFSFFICYNNFRSSAPSN